MKVVLIIPPHVFLNDQKRNCSLGIMYIASLLEQNNYHVEMVDLRSTKEYEWPENHISKDCLTKKKIGVGIFV